MKKLLILLGALTLWHTTLAAAQGDDELLEPAKAFAFSATVTGPDTIKATWKIAPDYYIYQNKVKFKLDGKDVTLKPVTMPPGTQKHDPYLGDVVVYHDALTVNLAVDRSGSTAQSVTLKATSQGCNGVVGVCYPPLTQTAKLELPAATQASTPSAPPASQQNGGALAGLTKLMDQSGDQGSGEFLPPDKAFALTVNAVDSNTVQAEFTIADGYYLYRGKMKFASATPDIPLAPYTLPAGEEKDDPYFGKEFIYHHHVTVKLPLVRKAGGSATVELLANYQGCAEKGICYPPIKKKIAVTLPAPGQAAPAKAAPASEAGAGTLSEDEQARAVLAHKSAWFTIGFFFLAGLGLAFTPCVFPMIPILSGIIVGQGEKITTARAFVLSLVYVLAMALTYTVAGVIAALFGHNLQAAFQNPWILGIFSAVFVLLALSMFGFYELQVPNFMQSKLTEISNRQHGGTLAGVAVMGFLSALIVGPCVAAPLAGALIYIGQTGNVALGGTALFALSLGMGIPLLVVGTSAGTLLPRAGGWMNAVKAVFGVLLLGVAVWMLSRILPASITLILYALLLIVPAVYLKATDRLPDTASGWTRLWKGAGVAMLIYGIMLFVGAFTGANDPLNPLAGLRAGAAVGGAPAASRELKFDIVRTPQALDARLAQAKTAGKPVLLDFYADWCVECVRMDHTTFRDPGVRRALAGYVLLRANVTDNNAGDQAMLKRFNLIGPPAVLMFDPQGKEHRRFRIVGYKNADEFIHILTNL